MNATILRGHICHSSSPGRIEIIENGYLVVDDGICVGAFSALPPGFAALPVEDYGDRLIIPGMTDLHLHAPQFSFRGLGMDLELLDWLEKYTFPEEQKYRELSYAEEAYTVFVNSLRKTVTTRAAVFATVHVPATMLLMDLLERSGLIAYVGKVNMDRNCPDGLREASAKQSLSDTKAWLAECAGKFSRVYPILTPRFIPTCSDELLSGLGSLSEFCGIPVQSHMSENFGEISWVRELCPDSSGYADAYRRFGLLGQGSKCIMAHCVHCSEDEIDLLKRSGVFIAHSPESNMNLASGVAPVSRYLKLGLRVGLATDLAGGSHESMFRAMTHAVQASKLRWRLMDPDVKPLTFDQAFYLATAGGGEFFGKVGAFLPGYSFDAVVLDDSSLIHPQPLSVHDRLERLAYLSDDRCVYAKYVAGTRLF